MPAPTPDELLETIEAVIAEHQPEGQYAVFEWDYLKTLGFRRHKTTSNAVGIRMRTLLDEGRLTSVKISSSGHLMDRQPGSALQLLYFQYKTNYHRPEWGLITAERPKNMRNVWTDGDRYLFTTTPRHEAMTAHFEKLKEQKRARDEAREAEKERRLWELLEDAFPGARDLFGDLREALETDDVLPPVSTWLREGRAGTYPVVEVSTRTTEQAVKLLTIIRRGLAGED